MTPAWIGFIVGFVAGVNLTVAALGLLATYRRQYDGN